MAYEYDRFDDEGGGGGAFVMGLVAGAVIGVGLGMLLAPKPGSELRSQLGETATRLRDRAAEGYSAASSRVADASTRVAEMYNQRRGGTASSPVGSTSAEGGYQASGSYTGGTAGTSGFQTGGVDAPSGSTASEF